MHPALWISKTGLDAQQTDISVISNNLANASTVGFKKDRAVFEDLLYQKVRQPGGQSTQDTRLPTGLMLGTGVKTVGTQKTFTQGGVVSTENALDLMVEGRGFLQVVMPDGSLGYTRNGQFTLDSEGNVVTVGSGYPLEPAVTLPADYQSITIGQDGTISVQLQGQAEPAVVGNIEVADFVNPAGLEPRGENVFAETGASGAPIVGVPGLTGLGQIRQGMLESSNVSAVEELVNLIETQRAYEMNSKVVSAVDSMLQNIAQNL
ncbi:MAG: flagellar basal-body rod protein FlgG [Kangiellaceae bacterium]|nr:flagellar basal-body rod protein FlgG [Kangiellaceae bacterium]|tara:strand:- start:15833 stop:16621 length:789 start_codon:yes stop_codon:yes gene_type:complete